VALVAEASGDDEHILVRSLVPRIRQGPGGGRCVERRRPEGPPAIGQLTAAASKSVRSQSAWLGANLLCS
jgi:hypothetical protein